MDSCSLMKEDQRGCEGVYLSSAAHSHSSGEADHQITLPAGYMGSGLIGAALISCVSFPHHPSLSFVRPSLFFAVAKR
jgi:hypothetical protein